MQDICGSYEKIRPVECASDAGRTFEKVYVQHILERQAWYVSGISLRRLGPVLVCAE